MKKLTRTITALTVAVALTLTPVTAEAKGAHGGSHSSSHSTSHKSNGSKHAHKSKNKDKEDKRKEKDKDDKSKEKDKDDKSKNKATGSGKNVTPVRPRAHAGKCKDENGNLVKNEKGHTVRKNSEECKELTGK